MRFRDLKRLRPDNEAPYIPEETLRKLELPMPEGVFTQLVVDHALTGFTQECYGELDLHGIEWEAVTLNAATISAAAVQAGNEMDILISRVEKVTGSNWKGVALPPKVKSLWNEHRTWLNLPLFVKGAVVGSNAEIQLVEGHRRLATLRGLVKGGWLDSASNHQVWLGRVKDPSHPEGPWRQVVRDNPVPFYRWLSRLQTGDDEVGKIVEVIRENCDLWYFMDPDAEDVPKVYKIISEHPELKNMLDILNALKEEWMEYTTP